MVMSKFFLSAAVAMTAFSVWAGGERIAAYLPFRSELVIGIDVKRMANCQAFKDLRKSEKKFDEDSVRLEKELQKYKLNMDSVVSYVAVYANGADDSASVIETTVTEAKFKQMIAEGFGKENMGVELKIEQQAGRTVFVMRSISPNSVNNPLPAIGNSDQVAALTYLDANHVLMTRYDMVPKVLAQLSKGRLNSNPDFAARLKGVNTNAMLWLTFNVPPEMAPKPQPGQPQDPMDSVVGNIMSGNVSADVNAAEDVLINGIVHCKTAGSAQQLMMQAQMMLMMLTGAAFSNDQNLAGSFNRAIKIGNSGNDLTLQVALSKVLLEQMRQYSERQRSMPADAAQPGANAAPQGQPFPAGNVNQ